MIEFNQRDFHMATIRRESKLFNLVTKYPFRVYGLKTSNNPLIHLSYNYDTVDETFDENLSELIGFFRNNGMEFEYESGGGEEKICIGLRRDLRDHLLLTCSIVQTMIYCLEGRLDVDRKFQVAGLPKFRKYSR